MGRNHLPCTGMFEEIAKTQELTNFLGQGFKYKDCSSDYKAGVSFSPPYCNIMQPDDFLKAYGNKTVPGKVDAKYKSSNAGKQWVDYRVATLRGFAWTQCPG